MQMKSADVYIVNADMRRLWQYFSEMAVSEGSKIGSTTWTSISGIRAFVHMGIITYNIVYPSLHIVCSTLYHDTCMLFTM